MLPPPLRVIRWRPLIVDVDKKWRDLTRRGYWAPVRVPLPMQAAAQNLILLILTSVNFDDVDADWKCKLPRTVRGLCRSIGLNHNTRRTQLDAAIQLAIKWFAEEGVELVASPIRGDIVFVLGPLKKIQRIRLWPEKPAPREGVPESFVDEDGNRGWQKLVDGEWIICGPTG